MRLLLYFLSFIASDDPSELHPTLLPVILYRRIRYYLVRSDYHNMSKHARDRTFMPGT